MDHIERSITEALDAMNRARFTDSQDSRCMAMTVTKLEEALLWYQHGQREVKLKR